MSQHSQFGHHHHHHPHSHPAVLHNASLADIASQPTSSHPYGSNVGSAVASSMHLTNSTSETDAGNATYKMEHDMMNLSYYAVRFLKYFCVCRRFTDFLLLSSSNQTHLNWTIPTMDSWIRFSPKRICCWQILIRRSMKVRVLRTWRDFCRHLVSRNISDCVKSLKSSKSYRYSENDDDLLFWAALLSNRAGVRHRARLQEL